MTKEQEKAIESMQNFVNSSIDTTVVTAKEMSTVLNLIQQLQEENKQKDKMIDEMIEEYEFFHRANIINFCEDKLRKNTCIQDCKNCIKQYFQKKVSEE